MVCKDLDIVLIRHLTTGGVEKHSERRYGRTLNASEDWTVHCSQWEHGFVHSHRAMIIVVTVG